ncbi:MAG: hypothetical protein K8S56_02940, partial [Candidatus Cloacimonetes bacterium]|nr:hypothetical protein [Candidatus Cloacimonadota bacterium]
MTKYYLIIVILLFVTGAVALEMTYSVEPLNPVTKELFPESLPRLVNPGEPTLGYLPARILLPQGVRVSSIDVSFIGDVSTLENISIPPAGLPFPLSFRGYKPMPRENPAIYKSHGNYPSIEFADRGVQVVNGYQVLLLDIYPYRYNPTEHKITWKNSVTVNITTETDLDLSQLHNRNLLISEKTQARLEILVDNPQLISSYRKAPVSLNRNLADPTDPFDYVIITRGYALHWFDDFVIWKEAQGHLVGLFTVEDIYNHYTGADDPEKIRNFVIDAYQTYATTATPLEYILLGGDDELVPYRGAWAAIDSTFAPGYDYHIVENNLPCDMYYSVLDGSWNDDADDNWGEPEDNPDMLPEVALGRITADLEQEFSYFFAKNYYYVDNGTYSNDVAVFLGQDMNWIPQTWGGDCMDEIIAYLPAGYHVNTYYDRESTFSAEAVIAAFNDGLGQVHHDGHCNESYCFGISSGDVNQFTNTEFGFAYTHGCHPAAFDEGASGANESIGEHLVKNPTGLFAFIGNTRYGWGQLGTTNGGSQHYHKAFAQALYTENVTELGKALQRSRDLLAAQAVGIQVWRWIHYELVLLGDPSVSVKPVNGNFPYLSVSGIEFDDSFGDGDNIANPGEQIGAVITVKNDSLWADSGEIIMTIRCADGGIVIIDSCVTFPTLAAGETVSNSENPLQIIVPEESDGGNYTLEINLSTSFATGEFNKTYQASFEVSLNQQYWPWTGQVTLRAAPAVLDTDGDGDIEIVVQDGGGDIIILNRFAEEEFRITGNSMVFSNFAIGYMNDDNILDIVYIPTNGNLTAVDISGDELFAVSTGAMYASTPVLSDIDGDNNLEIIFEGISGQLHAYHHDGAIVAGFPALGGVVNHAELAVADLDNDGAAEIIFVNHLSQLVAINGDGTLHNGFPVDTVSSGAFFGVTVLDNLRIVVHRGST